MPNSYTKTKTDKRIKTSKDVAPDPFRVVIYTRKSTAKGLEDENNTGCPPVS